MVLRHAILNGGRGGILSEKRRRRAAQAPGGTGGRVPHFPRLEPKWLLSLSLSAGLGESDSVLFLSFARAMVQGLTPKTASSLSLLPRGMRGCQTPSAL